jgi:hypothetical protein
MRKILLTAALVALASTGVAHAEGTPSPKGAKVYFLNLKDGARAVSIRLESIGIPESVVI